MNPGQLSPCSGPCGCSGTLGWPAAAPAARPPSWEGCVGASLGCWLGETSPVPPPRFGDLSDPPGGRACDVPCPPARTRSTSPCHRGVPFLAANLGRGGGLPWNRMNLAWRLLAQAPEPFKAIWVSRGLCSQGWSELVGCPAGTGSWGDAGEVGMAPSPSLHLHRSPGLCRTSSVQLHFLIPVGRRDMRSKSCRFWGPFGTGCASTGGWGVLDCPAVTAGGSKEMKAAALLSLPCAAEWPCCIDY